VTTSRTSRGTQRSGSGRERRVATIAVLALLLTASFVRLVLQ
jgi:hypothetical protein